jgi:hypothetical protein
MAELFDRLFGRHQFVLHLAGLCSEECPCRIRVGIRKDLTDPLLDNIHSLLPPLPRFHESKSISKNERANQWRGVREMIMPPYPS